MSRRYTALGFIAGLYQVAGLIVLVGALVLGGLSLLSSGSTYSYGGAFVVSGLTTIIVGALSGIGLYAFGELLTLFRDMELNSRITAENSAMNVENSRRMVALLEHLATRRRQPPQSLTPDTPRSE